VFPNLSHLNRRRIKPRVFASLSGALAALALSGLPGVPALASAQAATATCPAATLTQAFAPWGDSNSYSLVPGGDFEGSGPEWALLGGTHRIPGSESYAATGTTGAWSLTLPAGGSAQSPFMCVTASDRTFRLFARGATGAANLLAQAVYWTPRGNVTIPVGTILANGAWQPTAAFHTGAALATALSPTGTAQLALKFTSLDAPAQIDDVFLDPRIHH